MLSKVGKSAPGLNSHNVGACANSVPSQRVGEDMRYGHVPLIPPRLGALVPIMASNDPVANSDPREYEDDQTGETHHSSDAEGSGKTPGFQPDRSHQPTAPRRPASRQGRT